MRKAELWLSILSLVLALILLSACAPKAAQAPAPQAPATLGAPAPAPAATGASAPTTPARPAWQVEWDKIVAGARKDGTLVLFTSWGAEVRQVIIKPFGDKYGVRVESVSGSSSSLTPKVLAEQRAGIYSVDVWVGGSTGYVLLKGATDSLDQVLILPELTEPELIKKT